MNKSMECDVSSLQWSDTVGWVKGRASGLYKVGCCFVGGDDLTGALQDL